MAWCWMEIKDNSDTGRWNIYLCRTPKVILSFCFPYWFTGNRRPCSVLKVHRCENEASLLETWKYSIPTENTKYESLILPSRPTTSQMWRKVAADVDILRLSRKYVSKHWLDYWFKYSMKLLTGLIKCGWNERRSYNAFFISFHPFLSVQLTNKVWAASPPHISGRH